MCQRVAKDLCDVTFSCWFFKNDSVFFDAAPPSFTSWKTKQTPWLFSRVVERFFLHSKVPVDSRQVHHDLCLLRGCSPHSACFIILRVAMISPVFRTLNRERTPSHTSYGSLGELRRATAAFPHLCSYQAQPCWTSTVLPSSRSNLDFDQKKLGFDKKLDQPRFKPLWYGSIALAKLYLLMYCWAQRRRCLATKDRWKGRKPFRGDKRVRMWTLTHVLP